MILSIQLATFTSNTTIRFGCWGVFGSLMSPISSM